MEGKDYRNVFSNRLKYYMDLRGKIQSDLCKDLGFPSSNVSAWYTGAKLPRPETLDVISNYLSVKRSDLLEYPSEGDDDEPIDDEGRKLLRAYNNNSQLKILFDKALTLREEDAKFLIDMVERINNKH